MTTASKRLLPVLLLVSGFCGISYEILYTKLLGNMLGNQFTISAAVLLTFLGGIGLGTLYAHRFVRLLWLIEAGIGMYAVFILLSYGWIDRLLYSGVPWLGVSMVACALVSVVLLAVPAFLVGCSVPLFAAYLSTLRSTHVFSITYGLYNFGAALTALTLEFVLLRVVGLSTATLLMAWLNVAVALALVLLVRSAPILPEPQQDRLSFKARDLSALFLASVASAIFQLMMIKVAEFIFGPYNETFALVLATVLLGIAVGAVLAGTLRLSLESALIITLVGLALLLASLPSAVSLYAYMYPDVVDTYPLLVLLKLGLILVLMGIPAIGFGATIPTLLHEHQDVARESGHLLFVSSMANVLGFCLMAFLLHRFFDYGPLLLIVAGLTGVALLVHSGPKRPATWAGAALLVLAVAAWRGAWSEPLLYYGHLNFHSTEDLDDARRSEFSMERFKGHQDVFAITKKGDDSYFFINGYVSITLGNAAEKIVGALSSMLAPRLDQALVLGVGSGSTAGTVGLVFDHVDAVEINRVVIDNLWRMAEYNFDIEDRSNVDIVHDDGIHFVKTATKRYSLILNTVTTPLYFSSSKLYTRDFLEQVAARLTPDGVYTTWIDRKIGDRGVDIVLNTLRNTFESCWMAYLRSSYYLLACSNSEMQVHQAEAVAANAELRNRLARDHALPVSFLPYSIISVDVFTLRDDLDAPLNSLDFPVLEHEMARLDSEAGFDELRLRLTGRLDLNEVGRVLGQTIDWDPGGLRVWADLRTTSASLLRGVLDAAIPRQFSGWADDFEKAAMRMATEIGSGLGYRQAGFLLFNRMRFEVAATAFRHAVSMEPADADGHFYLGQSLRQLGESTRAVDAYREALRLSPEHPGAQRALWQMGEPTG